MDSTLGKAYGIKFGGVRCTTSSPSKKKKAKRSKFVSRTFSFMFHPKIKHNSFVVLTSVKMTTNSLVSPSSLSLKTRSTKISPFPPPWRLPQRKGIGPSWLPCFIGWQISYSYLCSSPIFASIKVDRLVSKHLSFQRVLNRWT